MDSDVLHTKIIEDSFQPSEELSNRQEFQTCGVIWGHPSIPSLWVCRRTQDTHTHHTRSNFSLQDMMT